METMKYTREVPDRGIDKIIDQVYHRKRTDPLEEYDQYSFDLNLYNDHMLHDEIDDETDPTVVMAEHHDRTILEMKEQLLEALNKRKAKVLTIALGIFNKV